MCDYFVTLDTMSTKSKKRIYISVSPAVEEALALLSLEKNMPLATTASSLLEVALEIEEDKIWNQVALNRKEEKNKTYSHDQAWG
jgi:hypothetical protein